MGGDSSKEAKRSQPGPDALQLLTASKQGRLRKKKDHLAGWPERYFVLDGHTLRYWKDPNNSTCDGTLDVQDCTTEMSKGRVENNTYSSFVITSKQKDVRWILGSTDTDVIKSWMTAIDEARRLYSSQSQGERRKVWQALEKQDLAAAAAVLPVLDSEALCELAQTRQFVLRSIAASIQASKSRVPLESPDGFSISSFWQILFEHTQGTDAAEVLYDTLFFGSFMSDLAHEAERMMKQVLLVLCKLDSCRWCLHKLQLFADSAQFAHQEMLPLCPPQCGLMMGPTVFCEDYPHTRLSFPISVSAPALSRGLTVMLWLFLDGDQHEKGDRHIFSIGMDTVNGATLCINNGRLRWGTYCADGAHELETVQQLLCNTWQHVAVTFNSESSEKKIYIDGALAQRGQNRARMRDAVITTYKPLRLSQSDCCFVLTGKGSHEEPSRWMVNDVLLSSAAGTPADIMDELRHQSKIRAHMRAAALEALAAPGETSTQEGLPGRSWTHEEEGAQRPKLNKVLLWWNAIMNNDADLCLQLKVAACPETCYWEPAAELGEELDMTSKLHISLAESTLTFIETIRQITRLSKESKIKPAISSYLDLLHAQQAYPDAYISMPTLSAANMVANLHRLDPVGYAVDCKTLFGKEDATMFCTPLLDRTCRAHAHLLTELLLKTRASTEQAHFSGEALTRRIEEHVREAEQIHNLYMKHLMAGNKLMLSEDSNTAPSPELMQFIRRAVQRYIQWLVFLQDNTGDRLIAPLDVELVHLAHMMQASAYHKFLQSVTLGPTDFGETAPTDESISEGVERTRTLLEQSTLYMSKEWGFHTKIDSSGLPALVEATAAKLWNTESQSDRLPYVSWPVDGDDAYARKLREAAEAAARRKAAEDIWMVLSQGRGSVPTSFVVALGTIPHQNRALWSQEENDKVVSQASEGKDSTDQAGFVIAYERGLHPIQKHGNEDFDCTVAMLEEVAHRAAYSSYRRSKLIQVYTQAKGSKSVMDNEQLAHSHMQFVETLSSESQNQSLGFDLSFVTRRMITEFQELWSKRLSKQSGDGNIIEDEFVDAYDQCFPEPKDYFNTLIELFLSVTNPSENLTASEERRAMQIFAKLDTDADNVVSSDELVVLHDASDRDAFIDWVDENGNDNISGPEWLRHLSGCKTRLGQDEFSDHLGKLEEMVEYMLYRLEQLQAVFVRFDWNETGYVEKSELLRLGQLRHRYKGKAMLWTSQSNDELVAQMDKDNDRKIDGPEFVEYFNNALPMDRLTFSQIIEIFMMIAGFSQEELDEEQQRRCEMLFSNMDIDDSQSIELTEVVVVQGDDRVTMAQFMDAGGVDGQAMVMGDWLDFMRHSKRVRGNPKFNQWLDELEAAFRKHMLIQGCRSGLQLTDSERAQAQAMYEMMDEHQNGFVEIEWIGVQDHLKHPHQGISPRLKQWLSWDGHPDDQRMLSREDWFGSLKDVHTMPGFKALLDQMEDLIQTEVDRRWKAEMEYRQARLTQVFVEFDYDGSGSLDMDELLRLGAARPRTKATVWTEARNRELLKEMDADGDDMIQSAEFVGFLNDDLPRRRTDFDLVIEEFLRIAKLSRAEREAMANRKVMSEDQIRRVNALFVALDADNSGEEASLGAEDQKEMLEYLDRDGNASVSTAEWLEWHQYLFQNLPARYSTYDQFLELLERLLEQWRIAEEKRRAMSSPSPQRNEWSRSRRVARTPRTPRSPRKSPSKALMNYRGHMDWILAVAVVELDGQQLLVSASQDMTARVFDVSSGEQLSQCEAHSGSVIDISWVPSSPGSVFTGSLDGHVCHWDLRTGELISNSIDCHKKGVLAVEASPDVASVFTGSRDNTAARWDVATGQQLCQYIGHKKWIQCLCLNGSRLYTGSADETVVEWDVASGAQLAVMTGHTQEITSMAIDGNFLYTGSREAVARRWNLSTKESVHTFVGHLSVVRDVAMYQGYLFTGSADGTARCWDVETGECKFTVTGHEFAGDTCALGS